MPVPLQQRVPCTGSVLVCVGPLFDSFLKKFQKEEPMIHLLYEESSTLLKTFLNRFVKNDVVGNRTGRKLQDIDVFDNQNLVELEDMEIGADTEKTLGALDEGKQKVKLYDIRKFYQSVSVYLQIKLLPE